MNALIYLHKSRAHSISSVKKNPNEASGKHYSDIAGVKGEGRVTLVNGVYSTPILNVHLNET